MINVNSEVSETKRNLIDFIQSKQDSIQNVLPKQLTYDKFIRIIINQFNKNPKLFECTISSVLDSIMNAAELGLYPSSCTGHAYLIPYRKSEYGKQTTVCQFQIGYMGLIELAWRTGMFQYINSESVYSGDTFEIVLGSNPKINHVPNMSDDRGKLIGYYAISFLKDKDNDNHPFKYMTKEEIDKYKPKKYESTFWRDYPDQMSKKTVIKNLLKLSFKSSDNSLICRALEIESENESEFLGSQYTIENNKKNSYKLDNI